MRYMMLVMGNDDYQAGTPPSPQLWGEIGKLAPVAHNAVTMILSVGLKPRATRIKLAKGKRQVTDGPFTETKEMIGGFAIFELPSDEEALAQAQRFVDAHVKCGVKDFEMEIRPMYGPEDFGGKP
jgi:hypothetical protein